jgi:hypothetical protein
MIVGGDRINKVGGDVARDQSVGRVGAMTAYGMPLDEDV